MSANERVVVEAAVVEAAEAVEVLTAIAVRLNGVDQPHGGFVFHDADSYSRMASSILPNCMEIRLNDLLKERQGCQSFADLLCSGGRCGLQGCRGWSIVSSICFYVAVGEVSVMWLET